MQDYDRNSRNNAIREPDDLAGGDMAYESL